MKNQNKYLRDGMRNNEMELTKAENITKEIKDNIEFNLYEDNFILL